jgi:hypothetical protein
MSGRIQEERLVSLEGRTLTFNAGEFSRRSDRVLKKHYKLQVQVPSAHFSLHTTYTTIQYNIPHYTASKPLHTTHKNARHLVPPRRYRMPQRHSPHRHGLPPKISQPSSKTSPRGPPSTPSPTCQKFPTPSRRLTTIISTKLAVSKNRFSRRIKAFASKMAPIPLCAGISLRPRSLVPRIRCGRIPRDTKRKRSVRLEGQACSPRNHEGNYSPAHAGYNHSGRMYPRRPCGCPRPAMLLSRLLHIYLHDAHNPLNYQPSPYPHPHNLNQHHHLGPQHHLGPTIQAPNHPHTRPNRARPEAQLRSHAGDGTI